MVGSEMIREPCDDGGDRVQRILGVLAMPRTVSIMRYLHRNGWYATRRLCEALGLDEDELYRHLEALEGVGLVERRSGRDEGGTVADIEFKFVRDIPEISLSKLVTEESPFLRSVKFYANLIFGTLERSRELDEVLGARLTAAIDRTNGWSDDKAKAVLSCFDPAGGAPSTYSNFKRLVAEGVLGTDDLPVLKKVALSMLTVMITSVERTSNRTISRLLIRVASQELMDEFSQEVAELGLLDSIPKEYVRQV